MRWVKHLGVLWAIQLTAPAIAAPLENVDQLANVARFVYFAKASRDSDAQALLGQDATLKVDDQFDASKPFGDGAEPMDIGKFREMVGRCTVVLPGSTSELTLRLEVFHVTFCPSSGPEKQWHATFKLWDLSITAVTMWRYDPKKVSAPMIKTCRSEVDC